MLVDGYIHRRQATAMKLEWAPGNNKSTLALHGKENLRSNNQGVY